MTFWLEVCVWIVALLLVYRGFALEDRAWSRRVQLPTIVGLLVILIGAGLWHWNARGFVQLAGVLQAPPSIAEVNGQASESSKWPLSQRKELSLRLARAVFASGGELGNVLNDDGVWIPYSPSADDVKAHDRQLKMTSEIDARRQELTIRSETAEQNSMRWLISLFIAICAGLASGRFRSGVARKSG